MSYLQAGEKMSKFKGKIGVEPKDKIVIDQAAGLVFDSENDLYNFFSKPIEKIETEYLEQKSSDDLSDADQAKFDQHLPELLDDPDEIWEDSKTLEDDYIWVYIKQLEESSNGRPVFHLAVCYLTEDIPSFVYLHFATVDEKLIQHFRRESKVYDREDFEAPLGAIDGDALNEGDELALGLNKAMMTCVRQQMCRRRNLSSTMSTVRKLSKKLMKSGEATILSATL